MNRMGFRAHALSLAIFCAFCFMVMQGSVCDDMQTLPLEIKYPFMEDGSDALEFELQLAAAGSEPAADGDVDSDFDGDFEGELDGELEEDSQFNKSFSRYCRELEEGEPGYDAEIAMLSCRMAPVTRQIDFAKESKELSEYGKYLRGIFVRDVTYKIKDNEIPADIPSVDVFFSKEHKSEAEWACHFVNHDSLTEDEQANCDKLGLFEIPDLADFCDETETLDEFCERQYWFEDICAMSESEVRSYCDGSDILKNDGIGAYSLVKLGSTHRIYHYWSELMPDDDVKFPESSGDIRIQRQLSNITEISETIKNDYDFSFDMITIPHREVFIPKDIVMQYVESGDNPTVQMDLKLIVIIEVKPI